jgi:uncharacterized protein YdaU (DUF1376 family)
VNFYKHHIGDYDADTSHLSWLEDMAYTRLMRLYYRRELPIPGEIHQACRLVRANSKQEKDAVESVLREFFNLEPDGWHNKRCDEEIAAAGKKAEANRTNGQGGGRPKKSETEKEPKNNPLGFDSVSCGTHYEPTKNLPQTPDSRLQNSDPIGSGDSADSVDRALFADARKVFGKSIGGQVNKAIKSKGKPWFLGVLESCRAKDPEGARAYFSAALNGAASPKDTEQRRCVP